MVRVSAAVIFDGAGRVLLCSRPPEKPPAGWEFPGGKIEPGETPEAALERELLEELALPGKCGAELAEVTADPVELHFIRFFPESGAAVTPKEGQSFRWQEITPEMPADLLANDKVFWEILKKKCL